MVSENIIKNHASTWAESILLVKGVYPSSVPSKQWKQVVNEASRFKMTCTNVLQQSWHVRSFIKIHQSPADGSLRPARCRSLSTSEEIGGSRSGRSPTTVLRCWVARWNSFFREWPPQIKWCCSKLKCSFFKQVVPVTAAWGIFKE